MGSLYHNTDNFNLLTADCDLVSQNLDPQVSFFNGDLEGFSCHLSEHKLL